MMGFSQRRATMAALSLLLTTACGGGKDDEEESQSSWQCYSIAFDNSCECYEIEPGTIFEYEGDGVAEVDECSGYQVCMTYFDAFFEENRCDCGPEGFMPGFGVNDEDIEDLTVVEACPDK